MQTIRLAIESKVIRLVKVINQIILRHKLKVVTILRYDRQLSEMQKTFAVKNLSEKLQRVFRRALMNSFLRLELKNKKFRSLILADRFHRLVRSRLLSSLIALKQYNPSRETSRMQLPLCLVSLFQRKQQLIAGEVFLKWSRIKQKRQLQKLLRVWNDSLQRIMRKHLSRWKESLVIAPKRALWKKQYVSQKLKGRILVMCQHSSQSLNLQSCFFRWRVKGSRQVVKQVIDRFLLNGRINARNAFWRLQKFSIDQFSRQKSRTQSKKLACINLAQAWHRVDLKMYRSALVKLTFYQRLAERRKEVLRRVHNILLRYLYSRNHENCKTAYRFMFSIYRVAQIKQKFFSSILSTSVGQLLTGFNKWQSIPAQDKSVLNQKFKQMLRKVFFDKYRSVHHKFLEKQALAI